MATTFLSFTTTPRNNRSDVINHPGKAGVSNISKLTDNEWNNARSLISDAMEMLRVSNVDAVASCSLSLTSGSMVLFQLTV